MNKKVSENKACAIEYDNDGELHRIDMLRALMLANNAMEEQDATADDFSDYLEALCDVVDGKTDFTEFARVTKLAGRERLN